MSELPADDLREMVVKLTRASMAQSLRLMEANERHLQRIDPFSAPWVPCFITFVMGIAVGCAGASLLLRP